MMAWAQITTSTAVNLIEIIGWDLTLTLSKENARQYQIQLAVLDPASDEHLVPC